MLSWLIEKLFLVKEIRSRNDELHFQRYRLLTTPWFTVYLHKIYKSDKDAHMHDHPFDFTSRILKGSYEEAYAESPHWFSVRRRLLKKGDRIKHDHTDVHKITVIDGPVWTFVVTGGKRYDWGYQTEIGFMSHDKYRLWKNNGFRINNYPF